jgi:PAS domain S-box-containing protein
VVDELIKSEERYETLANISPVGIFRTDVDGSTSYVNPTWTRISGLSAEEALGFGWLKAVHPDDKEKVNDNWQLTTKNKYKNTADYRFVHPDGSVVCVIGQAVPELNADNEIIGYVGTITDITERKQIEDLRLAVEKAESADKLKSAFLATMSHELRTPLNSIIGFTGILLQKLVGPLSEEQEKQLKMVQGSARHLLDLINDVLDISKIEAGEIEIRLEKITYNEILQKSLEKIQPLADRKGLKIKVEMDPPVVEIFTDRRRVEQVLLNLLSNAVKFTEQGEIEVSSKIDGNCLITSIRDSGIGIKKEDLNGLFMPFKQVDSGLTRQYEGTGLGLSICKRIVELLEGRIWVESEWGKGSSFTFSLPLTKEKND